MISSSSARISCALVLGAALFAMMPDTAFALGHPYGSVMDFDAAAGYTVPIQAVYQFPAALVHQPGPQLPIAPSGMIYIPIGEHRVVYR